MNILFKLKKNVGKFKTDLSVTAEKATNTLKDLSDTTSKSSKELFSNIAEKIKAFKILNELQIEYDRLESELQHLYFKLGETAPQRVRWKKWDENRKTTVEAELNRIFELENIINEKKREIAKYQKMSSENDNIIDLLNFDLSNSEYKISELEINKDSLLDRKLIREIKLPKDSLIVLIKRDDRILVPDGQTTINYGDRITIIGKPKDIDKFILKYKIIKHKD